MLTRRGGVLWLFLVIAAAGVARGQTVGVGTGRGVIGKDARVPVLLAGGTIPQGATLSAVLRLSNPTVFYPQRIEHSSGDTVAGAGLVRRNDSTWLIRVPLDAAADTLFSIHGELLAGTDSVCRITLDSIAIDSTLVPSATGRVISEAVGPPFPYVRFATIEQNYPNPVSIGGTTTWAYRIDKPSLVRLECYNVLGEQMWVAQLGDVAPGTHLYSRQTLADMGPGIYWVRLVTNSGVADKPFMVFQR